MARCAAFCLAVIFSCLPVESSAKKVSVFPSLRRHQAPPPPPAAKQEAAPAAPAAPVAPLVVPSAPSVGKSGFPELPTVNSMLDPAAETLKAINSQASMLEAKILAAQMADQQKMAKQKAVFEERLKEQEQANRDVIAKNEHISKEIADLKRGNDGLRKKAKELEDGNHLARTELKELQNKLGSAKDFVASSMKSTDDSKAKELQVLTQDAKTGHHGRHHHVLAQIESIDNVEDPSEMAASDGEDSAEDDTADASSDDSSDADESDGGDEDSAAFVQVGMTREAEMVDSQLLSLEATQAAADPASAPEANPNALVMTLQSGVANLAKQEKLAEEKLKQQFISDFQAGNRRHAALMQQQHSLEAQRASLETLQNKLKTAVAHLEETSSHLQQRLRGIGLFVQRLAHLALAPASEVPRLIGAMPTAVQMQAPPAKEA
eukprot:gnl/TRDRNA2_/TRDRNA2_179355_c0_seq1.p1 gnl/TRDRNA2_/TRDRNA2_179355_c0~~gnl/TRDRNA2_/TRDRNA2_179355_c0_seq1.p1  ORF type:complete len:435 (+),score=160.96 gnl/TRDRNA2_/TRDRNA2_179355_c0_seq1:122-1426(+)